MLESELIIKKPGANCTLQNIGPQLAAVASFRIYIAFRGKRIAEEIAAATRG